MGILADIFVASPDAAQAYESAVQAGDPGQYERVEFGDATPLEFGQLWAIVEDAPFDAERFLLEDATPDGAGESWLYRFPQPFVQELAALDDASLAGVVDQWCELDELSGADPDDVLPVLTEIRQLATSALASDRGLYLWGSI